MSRIEVPKVLVPKDEVVKQSWNKHLPVPLREGEKVISVTGYAQSGFVTVKHGESGNKQVSSFRVSHFTDVKGKDIV